MKKLLFLLVIVIAASGYGCQKRMNATNSSTYKGVVFVNACGQIGIQTIGPDYIGQVGWQDGSVIRDHVFKVQNSCQVGGQLVQGDTVSFKIVSTQVQNCMQCMMYVHVPDVSYPIELVN